MVGRRDGGLHRRRSGPGQDVEHDIGAGDPVRERFGSGALHGVETIDGNRGEDLDHLTVAIAALLQAAAQTLQSWRQRELLERRAVRSEEHTSELPSLMRISYAVFCLKKTTDHTIQN